jgi:hypothetical protein
MFVSLLESAPAAHPNATGPCLAVHRTSGTAPNCRARECRFARWRPEGDAPDASISRSKEGLVSRTSLKRVLATLAAIGTAAAILYNGHAGLGAASPAAAIKDGTSNTLMVGVVLMADMGGQFRSAGR